MELMFRIAAFDSEKSVNPDPMLEEVSWYLTGIEFFFLLFAKPSRGGPGRADEPTIPPRAASSSLNIKKTLQ